MPATRRKIPRRTVIPVPPDFAPETGLERWSKMRYTHALLLEEPLRTGWGLVQLSSSLVRLRRKMRKLEELWMGARRLWIVEVLQERPPRRRRRAVRKVGPALPLTWSQLRGVRRVWQGEGTLPYWHLHAQTLAVLVARGLVENLSGKLFVTSAGLELLGKNAPLQAKNVALQGKNLPLPA